MGWVLFRRRVSESAGHSAAGSPVMASTSASIHRDCVMSRPTALSIVPVRSLESLPECNNFRERQLGSFRCDGQCLDERGDVDLLALARATQGLV